MSKTQWNEDSVAKLQGIVSNESPVSNDSVKAAAAVLEVSLRSIASKLRSLGHVVESLAATSVPTFNDKQTALLREFVEANAGKFTYAEIAEQSNGGTFSSKQVQGKLLSMELTANVKAVIRNITKVYSDVEQTQLIALAEKGLYLEEIAEDLGKTVASVRGKALSLFTAELISEIPPQRDYVDNVDQIDEIMDDIEDMTVADIAEKTGKTERGVKTLLTRRAITCKNYDGHAKHEKALAKLG